MQLKHQRKPYYTTRRRKLRMHEHHVAADKDYTPITSLNIVSTDLEDSQIL